MSRQQTVVMNGAMLRDRRVSLLVTRSEVCARAGISSRTLWLAEGGGPIGLLTARRLAAALEIALVDVVVREDVRGVCA